MEQNTTRTEPARDEPKDLVKFKMFAAWVAGASEGLLPRSTETAVPSDMVKEFVRAVYDWLEELDTWVPKRAKDLC